MDFDIITTQVTAVTTELLVQIPLIAAASFGVSGLLFGITLLWRKAKRLIGM